MSCVASFETPGPVIVRLCGSWPLLSTSKVYSPGASVVFGSVILYSTSVTETFCAAASASPDPFPKISTAASIPKKNSTQTMRKSQSWRPGNCGQRRGTAIETTSAKPANAAPASPRPSFWPVDSACSSSTRRMLFGGRAPRSGHFAYEAGRMDRSRDRVSGAVGRPTRCQLRKGNAANVCGNSQAQAAQLPRCELERAHRYRVALASALPIHYLAAARVDEGAPNDLTTVATGQTPGYAALGERVAGILEAAEEAAEKIRGAARREAAELERLAEVQSERVKNELTVDARPLRTEAEEYARDMRLAVEAYATQHRRQAEEEGLKMVTDAEKQSASMKKSAEEMVRQVEDEVRRREEQLRAVVRMLEQRKRDSIERLWEIAALVEDVLPSREDTLSRDLERRAAPSSCALDRKSTRLNSSH